MTRLVQVAVPNHLGDAVMALPQLRRLVSALDDCRVRLVGRPLAARVLDGQGSWAPVAADWLADEGSAALLLAPSFRVALQAWRAGATPRIGTPTDWRRLLLTEPVSAPITQHHQCEIYRRVVDRAIEVLGGRLETPEEDGFDVDAAGTAWWRAVGAPELVIHPWAAGHEAKRWPLERWVELGSRFEAVAVTGGPSGEDAATARRLAERLGAPCAAGDAALTPGAWADLARSAPRLVLPDTGLAHLAAAVGARPLVLFGGTDPKRYAPRGARVLDGSSMTAIEVDAVEEALRG